MELVQVFVLGAVQGIAEFLPISSSGHLILVPWLFNWHDPGLGFDLALHWATLLAVLVYFWRDVVSIIRGFLQSLFPSTRDLKNDIYQKLSWLLIIASIPGAIVGKLLEEKAEGVLRNPLLVAIDLIVFGFILLIVDMWSKKQKDINQITRTDAVLIGLSQAAAIIPGVSRSGSTMTAGLALGFKREDVARFSFLMSLPITFGAGLLKIGDFRTGSTTPELLVGFISSAVFGFLAIKYLLRYLSKHDFRIFVWYRFAFAALIIVLYIIRR
jgi:undecaprenyl-diphosphatase